MLMKICKLFAQNLSHIVDINECSSEPCVYGDCTDAVNDYTCSCDAGYTGKNCDIGKFATLLVRK